MNFGAMIQYRLPGVTSLVIAMAGWTVLGAVSKEASEKSGPERTRGLEWKTSFHAIYQLEDGEVVKFVVPPLIPERVGYLKDYADDRIAQANQGQLFFQWDDSRQGDGRLVLQSASLSMMESGTLASALLSCARFRSGEYEFDGNLDAVQTPLRGDWILRKGASREDRLTAVAKVIQSRLKVTVHSSKNAEEREVLVAHGTFRHTKLEGSTQPNAVHFYTGALDQRQGAGGGSGRLSDFFGRLAKCTGYRVIDETESTNEKMVWANHYSAESHNNNPDWCTQLLKNLHDQTSLEFKLEKRQVAIWVIKIGDANQPKPGL